MSAQFQKLISPISIGNMWLKNRMVMSPMSTAYCEDNQMPSERLIRYIEERAKGGVGLITMELVSVSESHRYIHRSMSMGSDKYVDAHKKLTDIVHQYGCKIQPQLSHPGPDGVSLLYAGPAPVGPSVSVAPVWGWPCRELAISELPAIAREYGNAARRAKASGYDGIEIHAAHCYNLLGSFLSPFRNKRTDEYSAFKAHTRLRFIKQVLEEIKSQAGENFPVTLSISGYERVPSGRSIDDTQRLAPELVKAGVDCFRVSGGVSDALVSKIVSSSDDGDAINLSQAEAIKHVVSVPVMLSGRVHDPELAEKIVENGQADLVAMARPLLADPEFAKKVILGRSKDIRHCISCEYCVDSMQHENNLQCAINPLLGREFELPFKSERPKKILVVGSGVAGMEAARLAAIAGHNVILLERDRRLGGSLVLAAVFDRLNERYLHWLKRQIKNLPVELHLGVTASVNIIMSHEPDSVIVATGASIDMPDIPGIELPHVFTGEGVKQIITGELNLSEGKRFSKWKRSLINRYSTRLQSLFGVHVLRELTRYWMPLGRRVVIVGAGLVGIELAEFLARRGKRVHLLEKNNKVAPEVGRKRRSEHMERLDKLQITVNTSIDVEQIKANGVVIRSANKVHEIHCDNVIITGNAVSNLILAKELESAGVSVLSIGDSTGLGLFAKATRTAAHAVSQL